MATGRLPDPNTAPVTAKGDLYTYSTVPAKLAVGNSGETLVADSSASSGLRWQGSYAAGKNSVINGAFDYWQRGTTFTNPANDTYTADRWIAFHDGTSATRTVSQQALAPATITNFDSRYFLRYAVSAAGSSNTYQRLGTKIENVQNLTGTITVSFWAKADTNRTVGFQLDQYYGSGGSSATVGLSLSGMANVTTSWQRFTASGTMASISGKTIGDSSYVYAYFAFPPNSTLTVDIAGVQIEQGSVATGFTRAAGTLAGELAACKRYFEKNIATSTQGYAPFAMGYVNFATAANYGYKYEVEKRVQPTITFGPSVGQFMAGYKGNAGVAASTLTAANISKHGCNITLVPTGTPFTQGEAIMLQDAGSAVAYIEVSSEL